VALSPQPLKIGGETVMIPKNTVILPNYSALHTHPRYWGANSLEFEPSRWIISDPNPSADETTIKAALLAEKFKELPKHKSPFVGWSGGASNCPGRKFSQVEFVGVLVGLFRDFRVKPVPRAGEDDAMARTRLLEQIRNDSGMKLLLQMLHPENAVLQWTKR
jgi:cytochrome P450